MLNSQKLIIFILLLSVIPGSLFAKAYAADSTDESMNPLSTIISVPFENNTSFGVGPSKSTINVLNIKPVFPVSLGDWNLINRVTVPIVNTEGQDEEIIASYTGGMGNPGSLGLGKASGLADITYQAFITSAKSGDVAWGFGGSLVIPTHTEARFGADKWSAGPAAVMFTTPGNWVIGGIAQNIWSFAGDNDEIDVNIFSLQVAVNYKLKNRWYLTSAPLISSNWKEEKGNRWTVPLGGGVGRIFQLKNKKALAIDVGAYYNVKAPQFADAWYSQVLFNFLFPK